MENLIYLNNSPIEVLIDPSGLTQPCPYITRRNQYVYKDYTLQFATTIDDDKYYLCTVGKNYGFKKPNGYFIELGDDYSIYNYTFEKQLELNIYYKIGKLIMS
jgi:hypothetical protein